MSIDQLIERWWQSWFANRHVGGSDRERAFWAGYALARRVSAEELAAATNKSEQTV